MKIYTKLDLKSYLNLGFKLSLRKPVFYFFMGFFLIGTIDSFHSFIKYGNIPYWTLFFFLWIILYFILIYYTSKRHFKTNEKLQENIEYEFTEDKIMVRGETFTSEMDWSKIHKILELKDWVLIYQSNSTANIIKKEYFGEKIDEFRTLVKSKNVKAKLKA